MSESVELREAALEMLRALSGVKVVLCESDAKRYNDAFDRLARAVDMVPHTVSQRVVKP